MDERWNTIDTAPKDGSNLLLAHASRINPGVFTGSWDASIREWRVYTNDGWADVESSPTHWMQLPEPPDAVPA